MSDHLHVVEHPAAFLDILEPEYSDGSFSDAQSSTPSISSTQPGATVLEGQGRHGDPVLSDRITTGILSSYLPQYFGATKELDHFATLTTKLRLGRDGNDP